MKSNLAACECCPFCEQSPPKEHQSKRMPGVVSFRCTIKTDDGKSFQQMGYKDTGVYHPRSAFKVPNGCPFMLEHTVSDVK